MSAPTAMPGQVAALWPAPAQVTSARRSRGGGLGYLVVPSLRKPRYLVPADVPAAERMLASHSGSRADRAARGVWRRAHRHGLTARLPVSRLSVRPDPDGIEAYLADVVGAPVRIGVLLGPPRANLKPVVQIFDASGLTVAFAKLGTTALTASLLATEASALRLLNDTPTTSFRAPELLHHGSWKGTPILVQRALPLAQSDRAPRTPPVDVMVEIAGLRGITNAPPPVVGAVGAADAGGRWHGIDVSAVSRVRAALAEVGDLPLGCWHGDFGPWNMGTDGTRVEVWDWERFGTDVPVGLDAAHYRSQRGVATQQEPTAAWQAICADVSAVLHRAGADPAAAPAVAGCYLLVIVERYRADAVTGPTPALRRRLTWLAAVAELAVAPIAARQTGPA